MENPKTGMGDYAVADLLAHGKKIEARHARADRLRQIADQCAAEIMGNDHLRHRLDEQQQDEVHGDIQEIILRALGA